MTRAELRAHPEYTAAIEKIKAYRPGFRFHMDWTQIPAAKANALKIILNDAIDSGYLESVALDYDLCMTNTGETFRRTEKN